MAPTARCNNHFRKGIELGHVVLFRVGPGPFIRLRYLAI